MKNERKGGRRPCPFLWYMLHEGCHPHGPQQPLSQTIQAQKLLHSKHCHSNLPDPGRGMFSGFISIMLPHMPPRETNQSAISPCPTLRGSQSARRWHREKDFLKQGEGESCQVSTKGFEDEPVNPS